HVLRVRGGELRLFGCLLEGSLSRAPDSYRGGILLEGSGEIAPDRARDCAVVNSVLLSEKPCIQTQGNGARLRHHNSVLVSGGEAVYLDPGEAPKPRLNGQVVLDNVTVAARHAAIRLGDAAKLAFPREPFVVLSRMSLFLDPFT